MFIKIKHIFIILFQRSPDGEEGKMDLPNAKVVSILGNTGEGKSYALNRTFFARDDEQRDGSSFQEVIIIPIGLFVWLIVSFQRSVKFYI